MVAKKRLNLSFKKTETQRSVKKITNSDDDDLINQISLLQRDRILKFFQEILTDSLGQACEEAIYQQVMSIKDADAKKIERAYLSLAYNLIENLDPEGSIGNNYLRPLVLEGKISPIELSQMSNQELYPDKWDQIRAARLNEIKNENAQVVATTDLYKCGKCHKRECTYFQLQTRSSDEPITTFITCVNCGKKWRE